jgi:hypothetical protein
MLLARYTELVDLNFVTLWIWFYPRGPTPLYLLNYAIIAGQRVFFLLFTTQTATITLTVSPINRRRFLDQICMSR